RVLFRSMLASLPFAYMWMMPSQLEEFSQSLIAVSLFISNWLFGAETGYFESAAELKPLLHTWSLAVEEQYYFLFPVFLLAIWRFGRQKVFYVILVSAILSLLLSEWGWRNEPDISFYFTFSRFWELLVGSICAFLLSGRTIKPNNLLSLIGLAAVIFAVFVYDQTVPFPSVYTLVPVTGAALIILFAGRGTFVGSLLSMRGLIGVGLISYSAYLWHQPLFAFARLRSISEPSSLLISALAILALVLAWATWHFVEQPFRQRSRPALPTQKSVFVASAIAGVAFIGIGLAGQISGGFPVRLSVELQQIASAEEERSGRQCLFNERKGLPDAPIPECVFPSGESQPTVMMIGDSHSNAMNEELSKLLLNNGLAHYMTTYIGCPPIPKLRRFDRAEDHDCAGFNEDAYAFAEAANIDTVVLAARWPLFLEGSRFDNGEGGVELGAPAVVDLNDRTTADRDEQDRRERVLRSYEREIKGLSERFNVVLVYSVPEAGWDVPQRAFKQILFGSVNAPVSTSYARYLARNRDVEILFDKLVAESPRIQAARIQDALCSEATGRCVNADQGGVYYYDDDHLSSTGAARIAPIILEAIRAVTPRRQLN
uniref:acyltransferase family protein n=1 Tax=Yoonia sp. TaxID=2212373 RepID=UPI0035C87A2D